MNTTVDNTMSTNNVATYPTPVSLSQAGDAVVLINQLMVEMGKLFGKMRDLLRDLQQQQQMSSFEMQVTSYNTRLDAIDQEFQSKQASAIGQIVGGAFQGLGGAAGFKLGEATTAIGRAIDNTTQGVTGLVSSAASRESQEGQALADYQHGLADQQLKRADESLEKAIRVSGDMREFLNALTQAHERILSSVRYS